MPFKSAKQRSYMYAQHPEIARRWTKKYGSGIQRVKVMSKNSGNKNG